MSKRLRATILGGLAALIIACGPPESRRVAPDDEVYRETKCRDIPTWFEEERLRKGERVDKDQHYLWGYGVASSLDMGTSITKARDLAIVELAEQFDLYVEEAHNRLQSETGLSSTLVRRFSSTFLYGAGVGREFYPCREDNEMHRVYIGLAAPIGVAADSLLEQINHNTQHRQILQQTETYKELLKQLEWYRGFKKSQ